MMVLALHRRGNGGAKRGRFYGFGRLVKVVGSVKHPSGETVADRLLADIKALQQARLRADTAILVIGATP